MSFFPYIVWFHFLHAISDILGFWPTTGANFNLRQRQCSITHQRQDELLL